jgi:hypothetical protein
MHKQIFKFLSSLRLTVACLIAALILVFAGTLAQVHLGLWDAQKQYFHSLFVFWSPKGANWKIPVWPGGYLLGWVLLANLIAAHITRFQFSRKKIGIFLTHVGLIMLLVGQFLTENLQVETNMRLEEGETKNYSEATRSTELALIDVTDPNSEEVIALPEKLVSRKGEISHPKLPFKLRVKEWYPNSYPRLVAPVADPNTPRGTHGIGTSLTFTPKQTTAKMDDDNIPAAQIEIIGDKGVDSTWMVSNWLSIPGAVIRIRNWITPTLKEKVSAPQQFSFGGRAYQIALRPTRYYKPYSIGLVDFRHDVYQGTGIPKNFSSLVHIRNPATGPAQEEREVLIYMNKPLRYGGETYYQSSFEPGDTVTVLQVVRNPVWLTPYLSCAIVGIGLVTQFMMHLTGFIRRSPDKKAESGAMSKESRSAGRKEKTRVDSATGAIALGMPQTTERKTT